MGGGSTRDTRAYIRYHTVPKCDLMARLRELKLHMAHVYCQGWYFSSTLQVLGSPTIEVEDELHHRASH